MPTAPLFDLRATHPFYADGRCSALSIAPTPNADSLMRRLGLTCKTYRDHLRVYARLAPDGATVATSAAPFVLDFVLRVTDGDFALITDLSSIAAQPAPVFTNAGMAASDPLPLRLTAQSARAMETLTCASPAASEGFVLGGNPLPSATAGDYIVTGAGVLTIPSSDRRLVTVDTTGLAPGATFAVSYPVRPARTPGALAAVALTLDAPLLEVPSGPRDIVVPFAGAALIWAYYVVTRYAGDIAALRIVDTTPGNGPRAVTFGDAGRVDLRQAPDLDDAVGAALLRSNPDARVIRFLSNASVPVRETPLRHLELHLGDSRLAGDLANPRLDRFTSLRVAPAPAPPAAALYQVLTLPST